MYLRINSKHSLLNYSSSKHRPGPQWDRYNSANNIINCSNSIILKFRLKIYFIVDLKAFFNSYFISVINSIFMPLDIIRMKKLISFHVCLSMQPCLSAHSYLINHRLLMTILWMFFVCVVMPRLLKIYVFIYHIFQPSHHDSCCSRVGPFMMYFSVVQNLSKTYTYTMQDLKLFSSWQHKPMCLKAS